MKMTKNLYKVTLRGQHNTEYYGRNNYISYVVADNPTDAESMMVSELKGNNTDFDKDLVLDNIELVAAEGQFHNSRFRLFLPPNEECNCVCPYCEEEGEEEGEEEDEENESDNVSYEDQEEELDFDIDILEDTKADSNTEPKIGGISRDTNLMFLNRASSFGYQVVSVPNFIVNRETLRNTDINGFTDSFKYVHVSVKNYRLEITLGNRQEIIPYDICNAIDSKFKEYKADAYYFYTLETTNIDFVNKKLTVMFRGLCLNYNDFDSCLSGLDL